MFPFLPVSIWLSYPKTARKAQKYKKPASVPDIRIGLVFCLKPSSYIHQTQHRAPVCTHSGYLIFSSRSDLQFSHSGWSKHHVDFYWWFLTVIPQATSISLIQLFYVLLILKGFKNYFKETFSGLCQATSKLDLSVCYFLLECLVCNRLDRLFSLYTFLTETAPPTLNFPLLDII